jgi:hypothetical protein
MRVWPRGGTSLRSTTLGGEAELEFSWELMSPMIEAQ